MKKISINVQALARSDEGMMSCLIPDEGYKTISTDGTGLEPTIISHYSNDKNYRYAAFDGVGKKPFYGANGMLMLDDIYLMGASVNPVSKKNIRDLFESEYDGVKGFDRWLTDSDKMKKEVKKDRGLNKIIMLGVGYGMGAKKITQSCYDKGFNISFVDAKEVHRAYWNTLFPDVAKLRDYLSMQVKQKGFLVNPFGFKLTPDPHKALNYFIQSSVNGIIDIVLIKLLEKCPEIRFRTIIHDEIVFDVLEDMKEATKVKLYECVEELNHMLKWSVNVRFGWAEGNNWYEAK